MHMSDALLSPAVGGVMWAATAGAIAYSSRCLKRQDDDRLVPLMGVLGAFVFAAQMINFSIPGTGSSGHLGGGLLLAILLGPHAAFLTLASVLVIQALFFADGGLLALGCNIFNLGIFPCFIAYPLLYRPLVHNESSRGMVITASLLGAIVGLQMGAFGVVLETTLSGISALPFTSFVLLMQPIHLAIGIVEGIVTAGVILYVRSLQPDLLQSAATVSPLKSTGGRRVLVGLLLAAVVTGGSLSWFASANPDGLEWAIARVAGVEELEMPDRGLYGMLAHWQEETAFLPDYSLPVGNEDGRAETEQWPAVDAGTSLAGVVGGGMTLLLAGLGGFVLRRRVPVT